MVTKKRASKRKKKVVRSNEAPAPKDGVTVPRNNVGATVQAMIVGGATLVSAAEETAETWVVKPRS